MASKYNIQKMHLLIMSARVSVEGFFFAFLSVSIAFENLISVGIVLFCLYVICTVGKTVIHEINQFLEGYMFCWWFQTDN